MSKDDQERITVSPAVRKMFGARTRGEFIRPRPGVGTLDLARLQALRNSPPADVSDLLRAYPDLEEHLAPFSRMDGAAILLMTIPPESSASLFAHLKSETVEDITQAITALPTVGPNNRACVVGHFLFCVQRKVVAGSRDVYTAFDDLVVNAPGLVSSYIQAKYLVETQGWLEFGD